MTSAFEVAVCDLRRSTSVICLCLYLVSNFRRMQKQTSKLIRQKIHHIGRFLGRVVRRTKKGTFREGLRSEWNSCRTHLSLEQQFALLCFQLIDTSRQLGHPLLVFAQTLDVLDGCLQYCTFAVHLLTVDSEQHNRN